MEAAAASDETLAAVFAQLKPHTIALLELVHSLRAATSSASSIRKMATFLRSAPKPALQLCFDYTIFPLLMLLDAAVECRKQGNASGQGVGDIDITNAVAEAGLAYLEVLLTKYRLNSVNHVKRLILL